MKKGTANCESQLAESFEENVERKSKGLKLEEKFLRNRRLLAKIIILRFFSYFPEDFRHHLSSAQSLTSGSIVACKNRVEREKAKTQTLGGKKIMGRIVFHGGSRDERK
ncbi:hypothetical protein P5V15_014398 [Pogonomyrmex californicus]